LYERGYRQNFDASGYASLSVNTPSMDVYRQFAHEQVGRSCGAWNFSVHESGYYWSDYGKNLSHNTIGIDYPKMLADQHSCAYFSAFDASMAQPGQLHMATMVQSRVLEQQTGCRYLIDPECPMVANTSSEPLYTWLPDLYTLDIDHVLLIPAIGEAIPSGKMKGSLKGLKCLYMDTAAGICTKYEQVYLDPCIAYDGDDHLCKQAGINVHQKGMKTRIPIRSLLYAAGLPSLDVWNLQNINGTLVGEDGASL